MHISGGVAGFIGTYLTGPRTGVFKREPTLEYLLEDENFDDRMREKTSTSKDESMNELFGFVNEQDLTKSSFESGSKGEYTFNDMKDTLDKEFQNRKRSRRNMGNKVRKGKEPAGENESERNS